MFKILLLGLIIMIDTQANKLLEEDSPYLKQHAHNPVAWYPWGEEAFSKAKKEDKLIFLSIGYSTCHWCHVMERESFENDSVAALLNRDFIAIKVDREEYPHIDRYYQDIYMLMNQRSGGWPLTIVMTPEKKVFFSATYMPPEDTYGRSGLKEMMKVLVDAYKRRKAEVLKSATSIEAALARMNSATVDKKVSVDSSIANQFIQRVASLYDATYKGIGGAPKFPHATTLNTLLDIYRLTGDKKALSMATETLLAMSNGGIYDQIEGGFYRYSVDEKWRIPHFEKMLYTNAELLEAYANGYAITKNSRFKEVIEETIANIHERFFKEGLFYSASDADSDGEEGKYFLFVYEETKEALKRAGVSLKVLSYFSITPEGNFDNEGHFENAKTNPYLSHEPIPKDLVKAKAILKGLRAEKNYPFIDYKIQTSWNALYLKGLFRVARDVDSVYTAQALQTLDRLIEMMYIDKVLYHQVIIGKKPKVKGYLEDYAFFIDALIEGYQASFDMKYLSLAKELSDEAVRKFYHAGVWYMSDDDFKAKAEFYDTSYRSALAIMIEDMFKLALLTDNLALETFARKSLQHLSGAFNTSLNQYPSGLRVALESHYTLVVLKSTKENLRKKKSYINSIRFPFVLLKATDDEKFIACKIDRCFAIDKKLEVVLEKIDKL
jgi:uncharacterized protein YyaL (SSP411 family)